jgi:hypothetical protein
MADTGTRTTTFTITDARYIANKIGADLRQLNGLYGDPSWADIDQYVEEAALLLKDGYLGTVSYGFVDRSTYEWRLRLRYEATEGQLADGRTGSLPTAASVGGYDFHSYLTYSQKFERTLTPGQQAAVKATLPVSRVPGADAATRTGTTTSGNTYARNGVGVIRDVYQAL